MAWNLRGQVIETCSCNLFCPCWYGVKELMVMDRGWCNTTQWYLIQEGRSGGIDLAGPTGVLAMDFPCPPLFNGNGTGRIFVDSSPPANKSPEIWATWP